MIQFDDDNEDVRRMGIGDTAFQRTQVHKPGVREEKLQQQQKENNQNSNNQNSNEQK